MLVATRSSSSRTRLMRYSSRTSGCGSAFPVLVIFGSHIDPVIHRTVPFQDVAKAGLRFGDEGTTPLYRSEGVLIGCCRRDEP